MKPIKPLLILVLLVFFSSITQGQEKYSTVKIYTPADKTLRARIIALLQIDHFQETEDGAIVSEISATELAKLKTTSTRYEIIVDDVAKNLDAINKQYYQQSAGGVSPSQNRLAFEQTGQTVGSIIRTPSDFVVQSTFGGYYSFQQMETAMEDLVAAYPNIAQKTSIGQSHEARDIWCIKISDNVATDENNEPEVLFMGLQHAREAIGGSSMIFFMQYLCENYATDQRIKDLVDNREIYIIPCMNPDGWEYNRTHGGAGSGWRKNRRNNGGGNYGVDLNRNWGYDWGNCGMPITGDPGSCGTNDPSDDTYYGPSSFSEPETKAIRDFTYTKHLVAMIDQHSYGPYYSLPFGRPSLPAHTMTTADNLFYTYTAAAMGNYNGMRAGNSAEALGYEVAGGVKDWMLKGNIGTGTKGKVYGLTGEGGAGGGIGGSYGSFWAPAGQIVNLCKGMTYQNLQLLYTSGSYVNLQDKGDINIKTKTGSFIFNVIRVGLEDKPVTISIEPIENIQAKGTSVVINSLPNYYDTHTDSVAFILPPSLPDGQRIRFAWKIQTGGYTYYDTVTKFYNATQLFHDDMEGSFASKWSSTAVNSDPDVTEENWSFTASDKYAGSKSMTESASGNYFQRTTRTATCKTSFDLSDATAAHLSFWTKYKAENFRDKLRVQVSTNGTTWVSVAGTNTIQEPGTLDGSTINGIPSLTGIKNDWTRELFDLSAWIGTAELRLRFQFTSGSTNSFAFSEDDGFYIDEVTVVKSTAPLVTLPVHFISFTGKLLPDETVRLDWDATTDQLHDYFEVERALPGNNFISLGKGPATAPYWKIDPSPAAGNNFYRIKQVDKDGTITYSSIVNVQYKPVVILAVYPNPVTDMVNVKINTLVADQYHIRIADLSGRNVYEGNVWTGTGGKIVSINLKKQAAQVYVLSVSNSRNEVIVSQKLVKQ